MGHEVEELLPTPGVIMQILHELIFLDIQACLFVVLVIIKYVLLAHCHGGIPDGPVILRQYIL